MVISLYMYSFFPKICYFKVSILFTFTILQQLVSSPVTMVAVVFILKYVLVQLATMATTVNTEQVSYYGNHCVHRTG